MYASLLTIRYCIFSIFCLLFSLPSIAATVLPLQHEITSNGATFIFVKTSGVPILDIALAFDAGSSRDGNLLGLANFTSDMLNEGASNLTADDIAVGFDQIGAQFNAKTDRDMTIVSLRTLTKAELKQKAIDLFTKVITKPTFNRDSFKREQRNILNAIASQQESSSTVASLATLKAVYRNYPYGHAVIGTNDSVQSLTPQDLMEFHHRYYTAKNAIVTIVGDISKDEALSIAESITSALPTGKVLDALPEPALPEAKILNIPFSGTQSQIRFADLGISQQDPDYFPIMVGNTTLGGDSTSISRLYNTVREKFGLSYSVGSYFLPLQNKGPFIIALETRNEKSAEAIKITQQVLTDFLQHGPSAKELTEAKQYITGNFPLTFATNQDILLNLIKIGFYHLPWDYLDTYNSHVNQVQLAQVKAAFQRKLHLNNMITVVVGS